MAEIQKLETSEELVKECINDLFIEPRISIRKWSKITNQTAQGKYAYPTQHLASLITGIKGVGTSARGDDLSDGSEVKSCSKTDQLNRCKDCGNAVLSWQKECGSCGSKNITNDTSSHWIFLIRSDDEMDLLLNKVPRIILILFDKEDWDSDDIRIRAWVVNPKESYVIDFFNNYYNENYLMKKGKGETPAPCNLHPLKYDFFMMKPKLIFQAEIENNKTKISFWDLKNPKEQPMCSGLLSKEALSKIFGEKILKLKKEEIIKKYPFIPQKDFDKLKMRGKKLKSYKVKYSRR